MVGPFGAPTGGKLLSLKVWLDPIPGRDQPRRAVKPAPPSVHAAAVALLLAFAVGRMAADPAPPTSASMTQPQASTKGEPVRHASTGHVTNYDEAKVGTYTLPDPLVLADGRPVANASSWYSQRRPELLELYRRYVYGRVPSNAPTVSVSVDEAPRPVFGGAALRRVVVARFGEGPHAPSTRVVIYVPAHASRPVPLILHLAFNGENPPPSDPGRLGAPIVPGDVGPVERIVSRGYGYAIFRYTDLQVDTARTGESGIRALCRDPGDARPQDDWGTLSVWAWACSRILDYLETDPAVDAKRVILAGHSRLGKTALWAGAQDPRFALVFASCAGEMGSALSRRDFGETIDDMAEHFPWWFAPSFQQFAGHWDRLPVDAHLLIALNAPHPVFMTGGSGDLWADPKGEFLAGVAAGPVYALLGKTGLGTDRMPALDATVASGSLAYRCHTGPHATMPEDWEVLLDFADRQLR